MDLVFIVRDALASSAISNLVMAAKAGKAGREVAVLITQDALAAFADGSFEWPRALSGPHKRMALADAGKEMGIPVFARGEARQLDAKATLAWAREAGVSVYACPVWTALLGLSGSLPDGLDAIGSEEVTALLCDANQVVGAL
jgi:peroxiredoxin family protein